MNTVRAVCFDLDDTLYDYHEYAEAGLRSAADLLESRTGKSVREDLFELYFDAGVTDGTFDRLLEGSETPPGLITDLVAAYHDADTPLASYEKTEEVLSLVGKNHKLGLITDGREGHAKLDRLGIADHFGAALVTPTIGRSKHDIEVFDRVLSELSVPPAHAMYVGDDPRVDFRVPNELGMVTVRLRRGRYVNLEPSDPASEPDHEIDDLGGLLLYLSDSARN